MLREPADSVAALRRAFYEDDANLFLHCLSRPVTKTYSEHLLRLGWSELRPQLGAMIEGAEIVNTAEYTWIEADPLAPEGYVWPRKHAPLAQLRLAVDGVEEDFLFTREIDEAPENSRQSKGFWIGDRYFVASEHPSPKTYLTEDSPEEDRTHWRLVFPYFPFQQDGGLTAGMLKVMGSRADG